MGGWDNIQALARLADQYGLHPTETKLPKPIPFYGVGQGAPRADWKAKIQCAVPCSDKTRLVEFETPAVQQGGEELPILYGLDNMQKHNAILEMDPTKQQLTFPGPGGYTIVWAPGAVHIPLHHTPSGHLAFPLDAYQTYKGEKGGLESEQIALHTDKLANDGNEPRQKTAASSSSGSVTWSRDSHGVYKLSHTQ